MIIITIKNKLNNQKATTTKMLHEGRNKVKVWDKSPTKSSILTYPNPL